MMATADGRDWLAVSDEADLFLSSRGRALRVRDIMAAVAVESGVPIDALTGPRRTRVVAHPRQLVMLIAHEMCTWMSTPRIGELLGKDHTTIIHGVRSARARLAQDPEYGELYRRVMARLNVKREAA